MAEKNPYYRIRRSRVAGRGAFATRKIRKGTRITEYTGEVISDKEADRRYPNDDTNGNHHTFLFDIGWGKNVDASSGGNDARYINHSCDPNCEATVEKRRVFIDAIRTIEPGEELFYDYQYARGNESDAYARRVYPCRCGNENCRGTIMAARTRKRAKKRAKKGSSKGGGRGAKKVSKRSAKKVSKRSAKKGSKRSAKKGSKGGLKQVSRRSTKKE